MGGHRSHTADKGNGGHALAERLQKELRRGGERPPIGSTDGQPGWVGRQISAGALDRYVKSFTTVDPQLVLQPESTTGVAYLPAAALQAAGVRGWEAVQYAFERGQGCGSRLYPEVEHLAIALEDGRVEAVLRDATPQGTSIGRLGYEADVLLRRYDPEYDDMRPTSFSITIGHLAVPQDVLPFAADYFGNPANRQLPFVDLAALTYVR